MERQETAPVGQRSRTSATENERPGEPSPTHRVSSLPVVLSAEELAVLESIQRRILRAGP